MRSQPKRAQQARAEHDQLRVDVGTRKAERLRIELIELTEAPRLRPLVAEHRSGAPDALALVVQQAVADHRAHDAGGRLGAQRQRVAARILEGEHLLLHDVGELADRALEQRRVLDDRHADFLIAVRGKQLARDAFQPMPAGNVRRQDIVHPARRLDLLLRHSIASRSAVFTEVSDLTEPSASIKNMGAVASGAARDDDWPVAHLRVDRRRHPENHSQRRDACDRAYAARRTHVEHQSLARGIVDLGPRRLAELQAHAHFASCHAFGAASVAACATGALRNRLARLRLTHRRLRHGRRNDFARRCAV